MSLIWKGDDPDPEPLDDIERLFVVIYVAMIAFAGYLLIRSHL